MQLSDERLRQITNEQGKAVANEQREQAEQVLQEAVSMEQIRAQRTQASSSRAEEQSEWLQVGLDGGWLPSREQKGGQDQQNRGGGKKAAKRLANEGDID